MNITNESNVVAINPIIYPSDSFSDLQLSVIAIVPKISGFLSMIGSICIIFSSRTNLIRSNIQKRLLIGLSIADILHSSSFILSTWPVPKYASEIYNIKFNIGNSTTCNLQGFVQLTGTLSVALYNAFLCIYYYISVRSNNMSDQKIATRIEPIFHTIALIIPIIFSVYALRQEMFNPSSTGCLLTTYPRRCEVEIHRVECIRGGNAHKLRKVALLLILTCFIMMVISLFLLYRKVKHQERRMMRYSFQIREEPNRVNDDPNINNVDDDEEIIEKEIGIANQSKRNSNNTNRTSSIFSSLTSPASTLQKFSSRWRKSKNNNNHSQTLENIGGLKQLVLRQSIYYCIPFLLSYVPPIIQMIISNTTNNATISFFFALITMTFAPSQVSQK